MNKKVSRFKNKKSSEGKKNNLTSALPSNAKSLVKITSGFKPHLATSAPTEIQTKTISIPKPTVKNTAAAAKITTPDADIPEFEVKKTKIKIIGIGGGGGNIVSEIAQRVKKSTFAIANTDFAALSGAPKNVTVFQFGENLTHGLGTGMDPNIAEEAALTSREEIKKLVQDQDLVIIVASLGGGTGSGAAPIFAQISKSLGNLTYGIFTLPFVFEGSKKNDIARAALEKLKPYLNAFTILPNERVFEVVSKSTPFSKTLSYINSMLSDSLEGLIETIYDTGLINIDFADLRTILAGNGKVAFLNTITFKKGEETNLDSFDKVFGSPLYPYTIDKARGLLLNIVAQKDLKLLEVNKILTSVANRIHKDARIIFGIGNESIPAGNMRVTVLATGCLWGDFTENATKDINSNSATSNLSSSKKNEPLISPNKNSPKKSSRKKTLSSNSQPNNISRQSAAHKKNKKIIIVKKEIPIQNETNQINNPETNQNQSSTSSPELDSLIDTTIIDPLQTPLNQSEFTSRQNSILPANSLANTEPIRRNALQVKKDIEIEEKQMLEKEKEWDLPPFLRKKKS